MRVLFLTQAYLDDAPPDVPVGVIICKLDRHMRGARLWRGYIGMLSVDPRWRGRGIGARLIEKAVEAMTQRGAAEIVLETEVDNAAALRLYGRLGFLREKRLYRFYLNGACRADAGKDSFRLVLPVHTPPAPARPATPPRHPYAGTIL